MKLNDTLRNWWSKRWFKVTTLALAAAVLLITLFVVSYRTRHRNDPAVYGVSFSQTYAQDLGLDWQAAYKSLIGDMGFKKLRLNSYWDRHEATRGEYDFKDLDWQFDEAQEQGTKILLAVGLRQPRWPECREPEWAMQLHGQEWEAKLTEYLTTVVNRYKHHPSLEGWMLENEYGNKDFGRNCRDFDRGRIIRELARLRELDPDHQVVMSLGNTFGLPLRGPRPDVYAVTTYGKVYEARFLKRYIDHPAPAWLQTFRAAWIELFTGKPTIIHELQAEPWTRGPIANTSDAEQYQTMNPELFKKVADYTKATGIRTAYLWGGEWWYWRKVKFNDHSMWDIVKELVSSDD